MKIWNTTKEYGISIRMCIMTKNTVMIRKIKAITNNITTSNVRSCWEYKF